jgi:hypothetical protein
VDDYLAGFSLASCGEHVLYKSDIKLARVFCRRVARDFAKRVDKVLGCELAPLRFDYNGSESVEVLSGKTCAG